MYILMKSQLTQNCVAVVWLESAVCVAILCHKLITFSGSSVEPTSVAMGIEVDSKTGGVHNAVLDTGIFSTDTTLQDAVIDVHVLVFNCIDT